MKRFVLFSMMVLLMALPASARVYHTWDQDLGTFDYDSTAVGDSLDISQMTIKVGIQTIVAGSYDDSITIHTSQNGTDWTIASSPITGDRTIYLEPIFKYIRAVPNGGGTAGTIEVLLSQTYEL